MTKPKLSVGFPVYNGETYLRNALNSLLGQDFEDFELIISDNASTDGTSEICREYANRDKRIRYFRIESNQGATWNWRRVLELAEGTYFKWAAHDDECHPTMFRRCVELLDQSGPSVVLAYSQFEFIDEAGSVIMSDQGQTWDRVRTTAKTPYLRLARVLWMNLYGQPIYGVFRTDALRQTRPYGNVAPDWIKVAEVAMLGKIAEVPTVLFRLRRHQANTALVYKTWRELLAWHDPALGGRQPFVPYDVAIVVEYLKGVHFLHLNPLDKAVCYCVALCIPPLRGIWMKVLNVSGPVRKRLQEATGWRWLSRGSSNSTQQT
jgi:glycosyltransferase involved in cell wall biosynthesis